MLKPNRNIAAYSLHRISLINVVRGFLGFSLLCLSNMVVAKTDVSYEQCTQQMMTDANDSVTLGDIKQACREKSDAIGGLTLLEQRLEAEKPARDNKFLLQMHKPNYILLVANSEKANEAPFESQFPNEDTSVDDTEVKFQISVKFPLAHGLFGDSALYFAYTNRSFWQLYNDNSAPFRETNHEPEFILIIPNDWQIFGFKNSAITLGFVHQSNGRAGNLSRSWNRLYANFIVEKENWLVSFKPWYRIEEDEEDDDNPDIEDYMGNFELTVLHQIGNHSFSGMLRDNLQSEPYGAFQLDWIFPFTSNLSGYVQYFNGYGESMIDYNYKQKSIGIGVTLSGWL